MIAVQNVYYLLIYAWDALEQGDVEALGVEPETEVLDLLATVLERGIDRVLRQGLHRDYLSRREAVAGIRGKFHLTATFKADLLRRGQAVCEFDELSHDILHNQILKATIYRLLQTGDLDLRLREPLRTLWHRMHEVGLIELTDRTFRGLHFHRNNRLYRFLIDVCRLIHHCLIPNPRTGRFGFRNFLQDKRRMRMLFERFIRNFYWHHAHGYSVSSESFRWADAHGTPQDLALLPGMRTDVSLSKQGFVLVIDAKYYLDTLQEYRGHATIRSAHLYQLYAYLANVERRASTPMEVEGLLIYPLTTRALHLDVRIHDRRMRVETLDLNQPWPRIHADLLALLPS